MEFYNITNVAKVELFRIDQKPAEGRNTPLGVLLFLNHEPGMHQISVDCAQIVSPLLLDMYQSLLTTAECKMP